MRRRCSLVRFRTGPSGDPGEDHRHRTDDFVSGGIDRLLARLWVFLPEYPRLVAHPARDPGGSRGAFGCGVLAVGASQSEVAGPTGPTRVRQGSSRSTARRRGGGTRDARNRRERGFRKDRDHGRVDGHVSLARPEGHVTGNGRSILSTNHGDELDLVLLPFVVSTWRDRKRTHPEPRHGRYWNRPVRFCLGTHFCF